MVRGLWPLFTGRARSLPRMSPLDIVTELERRSVSAGSIDWECVLENGYRRFLNPQSNVLDVGAHAGRHARIFADKIGCRSVTIFEPLPPQRQDLERQFAHNPRVNVLPYALSSETGRRDFIVNHAAPEESGLRERVYNNPSAKRLQTITVDVRTLDTLANELTGPIDYIKIDTEGAEVDILRGAPTILSRDQPIISVEYGVPAYGAYGHDRMTLYDLATEMNYQVCDLFGNPFDRTQWGIVVDRYYWDYYLVPNARTPDFQAQLWDEVYRALETSRPKSTP